LADIKLIAFLGNYGSEYAKTRHNVAWLLADQIYELQSANWQKKFNGFFCRTGFAGRQMIFLKPQTLMNRSGHSLQAAAAFFKLNPDEILVVHDDLELDFCQISFKFGGGLAGHNGLRSINSSLGTRDFCRFRIGISRPLRGDITPWVLGNFSEDQRMQLPACLDKAVSILEAGLKMDILDAEKQYFKTKLIIN